MNLDEKLVEILDKTMNGLEKGTDFLAAELPDVVHQLLLWYGVYNGILFIVSLFIPVLIYYIAKYIYKYLEPTAGASLFGIIPITALVGFFFHTINLTWLKIWIAPKIWLIEYTATLVGK